MKPGSCPLPPAPHGVTRERWAELSPVPRNVESARGAMLLEVGRAQSNTVFPLSLDRCGPLGGNLAQALLFSRTAYGCSPQCLLPASSLEVKVSEPSRERKLLASLAVDVIRNHPSLKKKKKETIHPDAGSHAGRVVRTPGGLNSKPGRRAPP